LALLVALVAFYLGSVYGPHPDEVRHWMLHTGVEGELRVMPEIHIVRSEDAITQDQHQSMAGATKGVETEVEEEKPKPPEEVVDPDPFLPKGNPDEILETALPFTGMSVENETEDQIQMLRPTQQSNDFVLIRLVRPNYPRNAPVHLRQRSVTVEVAIYVELDGKVGGAYISSSGGKVFDEAVLAAVHQWEYRYVGPEGQQEEVWDQVRWIFAPTLAAAENFKD